MKILGMGMPELLIILAVVLLIFGPKHLPKLGKAVGSTVKNLREGLDADKKIEEDGEAENVVEAQQVEEDGDTRAKDGQAAPQKKIVKTVKTRKVAS